MRHTHILASEIFYLQAEWTVGRTDGRNATRITVLYGKDRKQWLRWRWKREWNLCRERSLIDDIKTKKISETGDHRLWGERQTVSIRQHHADIDHLHVQHNYILFITQQLARQCPVTGKCVLLSLLLLLLSSSSFSFNPWKIPKVCQKLDVKIENGVTINRMF